MPDSSVDRSSPEAHYSTIVALCSRCHDELHDKGKLTFEAKHRVCLSYEAERTAKDWFQLETGLPWHSATNHEEEA